MNYRLLIQYDGTRYYGWQRQNSTDATIQGKIEVVLQPSGRTPVEIARRRPDRRRSPRSRPGCQCTSDRETEKKSGIT